MNISVFFLNLFLYAEWAVNGYGYIEVLLRK